MNRAWETLPIPKSPSSPDGFGHGNGLRRKDRLDRRFRLGPIAATMLCLALIGSVPRVLGAELELNREPILVADLREDTVELDANGSVIPLSPHAGGGTHGLRAGSKSQGVLGLGENRRVKCQVTVLDLDNEGLSLGILVTEVPGGRATSDTTKIVKWGEELLVVLGKSTTDGTNLAVRITATPRRIEPIIDFPGHLLKFGMKNALYIVNSNELRSRVLEATAGGDPTAPPDSIQALLIYDPKYGDFTLSYREFPGSVFAGYIENERMVFQWGGDQFEVISSGAPVMPKGRWSLYVRRTEHKEHEFAFPGASLGAMEGPPSSFVNSEDH